MKVFEDALEAAPRRLIGRDDQMVIRLMQDCLREAIGKEPEITVESTRRKTFIITLPKGLSAERRAEVEYRLRELGWPFCYQSSQSM